MKQRMQGFVMGIIAMVLLFGTVNAFSDNTRSITATFGNVRTSLNGQEFTMFDDFGMPIEPLTYNGRVYIPMYSVLYALGNVAQWNPTTGVLNFTTVTEPQPTPPPQGGRPFLEVVPWFEHGGGIAPAVRAVTMRGISFSNAMQFNTGNLPWTHHNLDRQFTYLTGTVGRVDGTGIIPAVIRFIGDGEEIALFTISADFEPQNISINVAGVRTLRIEVVGGAGGGSRVRVAFANPRIH